MFALTFSQIQCTSCMFRGVHEGFKQMLRAGAHCMDLVLSVNNSNQESLSAADFVRLAAKLGVRTEEFEVE
jgi:hypothetical protein